MRNSVLEITDQEYLIKLDKTEFDLSFIQSLLKRIQTEKTFFSRIWEEEDIISRRSLQDDAGEDHLSEK
ncbi:hypothetical protein [Pedobacter alpinus]|uniref:Uncharacterized protein n=1 Tax=Pedobacter alpinus TaxID=1590643 RepID=A0ABW5TWF6_9SPHI